MATLDGTSWDVVIAGTGLQSALLALALSRSGKKILHLDSNDYYGGREAALSISEAEEWAKRLTANVQGSPFRNISVEKPDALVEGPKLASPRSYSLSLSPCLLYTRSALLPALVSSKTTEQLEFLAVGSWFVWRPSIAQSSDTKQSVDGSLIRVPNSREDIFSDSSLTLRAKSALVKFLRFVAVYQDEDKQETWQPYKSAPFADLLAKQFKIPADFHGPLLALTMSTCPSNEIETEFALQAIHRHLTSMGIFGAGFSAVLLKYGGLSEVVQVACRAAAVGGAVYVLDRKVDAVDAAAATVDSGSEDNQLRVSLQGGDSVNARLVFGTDDQLPESSNKESSTLGLACSRSITIVDSKLASLFPPPAEGSPSPSAAVVVFPSGSLGPTSGKNEYPVHVLVHSGDTGECPSGQCVIYASTMQPLVQASSILDTAVQLIISSSNAAPSPVLWNMKYEVLSTSSSPTVVEDANLPGLYRFVEAPVDTVFDDRTVASVKDAWKVITNEGDENFMKFSDRNAEMEQDAARDEVDA
ncbi:hypothetical protein K461DRAFT_288128 [Myriangium duriaei CBS 260.36]|uniref:Rab proteins geranylgeranyltransferase n=1 Tax=Myriangium duriaei CBS 260.36 TaxID=1168546 RepID=A0A9P4IW65_9PEZI|nr:hypothetical protein K461DRAFT_288128 [Myriangium duriaei CBS 260.36]